MRNVGLFLCVCVSLYLSLFVGSSSLARARARATHSTHNLMLCGIWMWMRMWARGVDVAVVIDPPFITEDVWSKYAETAKMLLKEEGGQLGAQPVHRRFRSARPQHAFLPLHQLGDAAGERREGSVTLGAGRQ